MSNDLADTNDKNVVESTQELKQHVDTFDFEPLLYSFKVSPFSHSSSTMLTSISDDRLHQDHAFGIIWLLFSEQKKSPSIFQLHWSLQFLKKLKNNDGAYTDDVNKCIQMIQDNLIRQYAKLGISLKHINDSIKDDEKTFMTSTPKPSSVQKSLDTNTSKELLESITKDFDFQRSDIILKDSTTNIISFTYNEMISKGEVPCIEEINYNVLLELYLSSHSLKEFIEDLELPKESDSNMSIEELLEVFNKIRKEYVEIIKREVDKIDSIENLMQSIEKHSKSSFKAYIANDLMKFINKLVEDIKDSMEKLIV